MILLRGFVDIIDEAFYSFLPGAVGTAKNAAFTLDTVPDDAAVATGAYGSELMNSAFEGVEDKSLSVHDDLETLVVRVSTAITGFHGEK